MRLKELAELQNGYRQLLKNGITKKAMCNLVIPFRDKWGLSDKQALMIARNEICLDEICKLMNNPQKTNADRIRAMNDDELAKFLATSFAEQKELEAVENGFTITATYLYLLHHTWYVTWMQWLQKPAEEVQ